MHADSIVLVGEGESKGFGFIKFAKVADADEAFRTMDQVGTSSCDSERFGLNIRSTQNDTY